jgi:subtilisin family serine protease
MLVDIFAPGVDIYSTALKSKYRSSSGTSDASPVVCGVAALVLSYYPDLTAEELKSIILESGTYYGDLKVLKPEEYKKRKKKKFKKLCSNPRVVNANSALRMAYERQNSGN